MRASIIEFTLSNMRESNEVTSIQIDQLVQCISRALLLLSRFNELFCTTSRIKTEYKQTLKAFFHDKPRLSIECNSHSIHAVLNRYAFILLKTERKKQFATAFIQREKMRLSTYRSTVRSFWFFLLEAWAKQLSIWLGQGFSLQQVQTKSKVTTF